MSVSPTTSASDANPAAPRCATCGAIVDGPFCARDGTLVVESFVIGERYAVDKLIGGGGHGFVFGGKHLVLGKPVAIKILRDRGADSLAAKRFLREARTASQFGHEHIISILDFGHCATHDVSYLVMEWFQGVTLSDVIRTSAPVPVSRALPMLIQLADALAAAHAADVFHRDVTPRNVLVGRGDFIKLCDFGLSRSLAGDDRVTSTGVVIGTPAYMAPEAIRGTGSIDQRVDVYGFGCTAYEILTGRVPHAGATPVALLANRVNDGTVEAIAVPGKLPAALEELVVACLATSPDARPSASELVDKLRALAARTPGDDTIVRRIGNYDVIELIGSGGSGAVYRGKHPLIGTEVAIKVLHREVAAANGMADRFIQEARASSELLDPHIPRYFDFGYLADGQPYAVLELLAGETLAKRLERAPLTLAETTDIVRQVATTMVRVHAAGIVHRDLKPDNLFLTPAPDGVVVKILDFGIAKALAASANIAQTSLGLTLGTPAYCAPEQALGLSVDQTADIYALGATAFEMITRRTPFEGTVSRVLGTKTTTPAPALESVEPRIPVEVARTIDRMLAREATERQATMQTVLDELASWPAELHAVRAIVAAPPHRAVAITTAKLAPPASRRWLVRGAIVAAGVVAMVALALGLGWFDGDSPASSSSATTPSPPAPTTAPITPPAVAPPAATTPEAATTPPPHDASTPLAKPPAKQKRPVKKPKPELMKPKDDALIVDPYAK